MDKFIYRFYITIIVNPKLIKMKDTIYGNIKVPIGLLEEVDKIIDEQSNGYRSRNEFCVDAVRRVLREFKDNGGEKDRSINNGKTTDF